MNSTLFRRLLPILACVLVLQEPGLAAEANAVTAGEFVALPNVNDGFSGRASDLGALEAGAPVPHFGPRPSR